MSSLATTGGKQDLQPAMRQASWEAGSQHLHPHALPFSPLSMEDTSRPCPQTLRALALSGWSMRRCQALRLAAPHGLHRAAQGPLDMSLCRAHPLGVARPMLLPLEAWPVARAGMQFKGSTQLLCQRRCVPDASSCCALLHVMTKPVVCRRLRL